MSRDQAVSTKRHRASISATAWAVPDAAVTANLAPNAAARVNVAGSATGTADNSAVRTSKRI